MAKDKELKEDVQKLLQEVVVTEASQQVWKLLENSLQGLDEGELAMLRDFFQGLTPHEIAHKWNVDHDTVVQGLKRARSRLVERIKSSVRVRQ